MTKSPSETASADKAQGAAHPVPRVGTAGWSLPSRLADTFPGKGQHLARYARVLNAVEINSSFYRRHQRKTYERWAEMTPSDFRFAVKVPRTVTHERRLRDTEPLLRDFLDEIAGLGTRLGPLLVQLPPSLKFDPAASGDFFALLRALHPDGTLVCEPRHASWLGDDAQAMWAAHRVGQVIADPARPLEAARPGGWLGDTPTGHGATLYLRLHGSPKIYWSAYDDEALAAWAQRLRALPDAQAWCVFDNTAAGAAMDNALALQTMV